jgi:hypothetical protein
MIIDKSSSEISDLKTRLYQVVAENKISSLSMICGMIGAEEEQTRLIIEELVDEGTLEGSFTSDGQRFFLSKVKVSTAPIESSKDEGYVIEKADTRQGKMILLSGLAMMIAGYIVRGFVSIFEISEQVGTAVLMVGLAVLIIGWLMITRADPPSNIK